MMEVQKVKLEQALRILASLTDHVRYAVEWDNRVFGNAELTKAKPPKGGKRRLKYPMGTLSTYTKPFLDMLEVEGVVEIPWGQFEHAQLSGSVSATCSTRFGRGVTTITTNKINETIEVWLDTEAVGASVGQIEMFDTNKSHAA